MDWSADSKWIRSTAGDHVTHYFDVAERTEDPRGATHALETTWATQTLKLGADRAGIKPPGEDGTHVNDVAVSPDGAYLVTADDFGLVNVFSYPVGTHPHATRSYSAHSEHAVRVAFSRDGKRLFSVGGQDKTLIQWRIKPQ
jgi:WD40 repeat protein